MFNHESTQIITSNILLRLVVAMSFVVSLSLTGCNSTEDIDLTCKSIVIFKGSKEYNVKVKEFNISPEQAASKVYKNPIHSPAYGILGHHNIIIDDYYIFPYSPDKMYIPLDGYYVNGYTGKKYKYRAFYFDSKQEKRYIIPPEIYRKKKTFYIERIDIESENEIIDIN